MISTTMFHLCKHQHHRRQHHHHQHHHHHHHNHNYHGHDRWTQGSANGWTTRSVCALFVTSRLARRWPTGLSMYILYIYCNQYVCLYIYRYMFFVVVQCIFQSTFRRLMRRWPTVFYAYFVNRMPVCLCIFRIAWLSLNFILETSWVALYSVVCLSVRDRWHPTKSPLFLYIQA